MGRQIIKQPNGKYAIWSSVVDDFIYLNITPEEYIEERIKEEAEQIRDNVMKVVKLLDEGKPAYYQFTKSWEQALSLIEEIHGKKAKKKVLKDYEEIK